jgi:hypothetical protein
MCARNEGAVLISCMAESLQQSLSMILSYINSDCYSLQSAWTSM